MAFRQMAFRTFFTAGGVLGLGSLFILIFFVHPKDEPLDKSFQGHWRARYHAEHDASRRQGLAGPEKRALEDQAAKVAKLRSRLAEGGDMLVFDDDGIMSDDDDDASVAPGARCCDDIFFGNGTHVRLQLAMLKQRKRQRRAGLLRHPS